MSKKSKHEKTKEKSEDRENKSSSKYLMIFLVFVIIVLFIYVVNKTTPEGGSLTGNLFAGLKGNSDKIEPAEVLPTDNLSYQTITQASTLEDFKGRYSLIYFGGTYCPHCRTGAPKIKTLFWNSYKDVMNIWIQVIDSDAQGSKTFDVTEVQQGNNKNLEYTKVSGEPCNYVPSFVILDPELNVLVKSCGSVISLEKALEILEEKI